MKIYVAEPALEQANGLPNEAVAGFLVFVFFVAFVVY